MCGIVGIWSEKNASSRGKVERGIKQLTHRGPDSHGMWTDTHNCLILGHTRLAIQDLSAAGNQPMISHDSRYTLVFNGEIYNNPELRGLCEKLGHKKWEGHSDTETLLTLLTLSSLPEVIDCIDGMFAFALWDSSNRTLILGRDRFGEKPLYYSQLDNCLFFASELKAFPDLPKGNQGLSTAALSQYLTQGYISAPLSIYENIYKVSPGEYLIFRHYNKRNQSVKYWCPEQIINMKGEEELSLFKLDELSGSIKSLLIDSVRSRCIGDVAVGSFLSGGVDSSLITSIAAKELNKDIMTFSIGFKDKAFDESNSAKRIARHLGVTHREHILCDQDVMYCIQHMPHVWDEPFDDSSQIPTFILSQITSKSVKVALSGDGGDELFYGYTRYKYAKRLSSINSLMPSRIKSLIASYLFNSSRYDDHSILPHFLHKVSGTRDIRRVLRVLSAEQNQVYEAITQVFARDNWPLKWNIDEIGFKYPNNSYELKNRVDEFVIRDIHSYLPDDILVKVDRASMNFSLEARAPFLNHNLFRLVHKLPSSIIFTSPTKGLARNLLRAFIPKNLIYSGKKGFGVPLKSWTYTILRPLIYQFLSEELIVDQGIFEISFVKCLLRDHYDLGIARHHQIWNLLAFQLWYYGRSYL